MNNQTLIKGALAVAISLALSTSANAQCKLRVWEDIDKAQGIEKAVADFEKEFDCQVSVENSPYVGHLAMMQDRETNGGALPDIVMLPADRLGDAAKNKLLKPLNFINEDQDNYLRNSLTAFTYKGEIYGCPRSVETMIVYYNQDLMKYPFEYMEDYYEFAQKMADKGLYGIVSKWDTIYYSYAFIKGFGGYVFGQKNETELNPNDIGLDNDGAVKGVEYLQKFMRLAPKGILGDQGYPYIDNLFTSGKVACVITGPWALDAYAKAGINYGVAPLPKLPNGNFATPFLGFRGYAVTKYAQDQKLAEKFLRYINQDKYALERYNTIHELPPIKSLINSPEIINDDFAASIGLQALHAEPTPTIPEMAQIWEPMNTAVGEAVTGAKDAREAMHEGAQKARDAIAAAK